MSHDAKHSIAIAVFCLAVGYGFGRHVAPDKIVTVDHTEELFALRSELALVKQENTTLKRHTVKHTITTFSPTTGKPLQRTDTVDTHVDRTSDARTDVKANTDAHSAKLITKTVTVERDRPMNRLGLIGSFDSRGRWGAGPQFQRRLFGPVIGSVQLEFVPPRDVGQSLEFGGGLGFHLEF